MKPVSNYTRQRHAIRKLLAAGRYTLALCLVVLSGREAFAALPEITVTRVGSPVWKPVDFQLFSAPATPFNDTFPQVYRTLLPNDNPYDSNYTPHAPPYDTELSAGMIAGGYVSRSVFTPYSITLQPNGVYFAFMFVPNPGTTGSSRDFASGPVIPNSLYPIAVNIDVWLDGVLVDRTLGADAQIPVQPRDAPFQGTSHLEYVLAIWHPWDDDLTVGPLGDYELRATVRDNGGFGWDIVAPFQVVPDLDGDFNHDGSVDGADYVVWRNGLSTGAFTQDDYSLWRTHFGQSIYAASGGAIDSGSNVPEPTGLVVLVASAAGSIVMRRRRFGRSDVQQSNCIQQQSRRDHSASAGVNWRHRLATLAIVFGGATIARGQTNPYQPIASEIQSMIDLSGQFSDYHQASTTVYTNILGGKQLDITLTTGSPGVNEVFTRVAPSQDFPDNNGDGDGGDLDAFDGVAWNFLSDTSIVVKPFTQSWGNFNFQEGSQPSTGCGIGCICVPANVPTTVWMDWNVVTSSFPASDRGNIFRLGFQIFGPSPPQDGTTIHATVAVTSLIPLAPYNIFQWEYINPNNPSQGKQESIVVAPGGTGLQAQPGLNAAGKNLTAAYLIGANLTGANFTTANLFNADLSNANLTNSDFREANLTSTDFSGAEIRGAMFGRNTTPFPTSSGIAGYQLASTASYQARDLTGVDLHGNDLNYADLAGQNMTNVNLESAYLYYANFSSANLTQANLAKATLHYTTFDEANLTGAILTDAIVNSTNFAGSNVTLTQIYSTADYKNGNLSGIGLANTNLTGANFDGKSVSFCNFSSTNLQTASFANAHAESANFTGANLGGANFSGAYINNVKFSSSNLTPTQLQSTANYQTGNLDGIELASMDLSSAMFAGKSLQYVNFSSANLQQASFVNANLRNANFSSAILTGATLNGADVKYAKFMSSNLALAQLYSTSSYVSGNLEGIELAAMSLPGAAFAGKTIQYANFTSADLQQTTFANANLGGTRFINADLSGANLSGAVLSTANHEGADFTGANFSGANFNGANIKYAKFTKSNITPTQLLSTASFQQGNLDGFELTGANFTGVQFAGKSFVGANFSSSNFTQAGLSNTNFSTANLTRVRFDQANFTNANLTGANLTGANLSQTVLTDAIIRMAKLSSTHITLAQLYSTASYKNHDLKAVFMIGNDLSGANLTGQELSGSDFYAAKLGGADFTSANMMMAEFINADMTGANLTGVNVVDGSLALANLTNANLTNANLSGTNLIGTTLVGANIRGASLSRVITTVYSPPSSCKYCCGYSYNPGSQTYVSGTGVTLAQLSSTASYVARDLSDVSLTNNDFSGGNFVDFNLANSNFSGTPLTSANLTRADARGANGLALTNALVANLIRSNGHITGLNLGASQVLNIRDFDGAKYSGNALIPITVDNQFAINTGGSLRMLFEADAWNSTISFAPGIPVTRGGTLELLFASGTSLTNQIGRTFSLFNWNGVSPTGSFAVSSPYTWDVSKLYTTGEVTLLAASGAPGDFNNDGRVDSADYVVWRKVFGPTYGQPAYNVWRKFYDQPAGSGSIFGDPSEGSVPEPSVSIMVLAVLMMSTCRRSCLNRDFPAQVEG